MFDIPCGRSCLLPILAHFVVILPETFLPLSYCTYHSGFLSLISPCLSHFAFTFPSQLVPSCNFTTLSSNFCPLSTSSRSAYHPSIRSSLHPSIPPPPSNLSFRTYFTPSPNPLHYFLLPPYPSFLFFSFPFLLEFLLFSSSLPMTISFSYCLFSSLPSPSFY